MLCKLVSLLVLQCVLLMLAVMVQTSQHQHYTGYQGKKKNQPYVCSVLLSLQVWTLPLLFPWMFSREKVKWPCSVVQSSLKTSPQEQPPQDHSTCQYVAQRTCTHHSDLSITVTISPSDWSPLASKLGYFPALSWRKHFVGSIINLTTKLWLVLSGDWTVTWEKNDTIQGLLLTTLGHEKWKVSLYYFDFLTSSPPKKGHEMQPLHDGLMHNSKHELHSGADL